MSDSNNQRKATDLLLELEAKVNAILGALTSIDFNQKVISNKLSELLNEKASEPPKFTVETINVPSPISLPERTLPVLAEDALPVENEPKGFRRTSRPETFAGDNSYLKKPAKPAEDAVKFPVQIPRGNKAEVIVPSQINKPQPEPVVAPQVQQQKSTGNKIPVSQRMVDKNGKSIFLANVSIIDNATKETIFKDRTNGTGKWNAPLSVGEYTVIVNKRNGLNDQSLQSTQTIQVDGSKSPLELPVCIIKD